MSKGDLTVRAAWHHIGVIVLNYNGAEHTVSCVRSIVEKTPPELDYAVLVVDNASRREDRARLVPLLSLRRVTIVDSRFNLGYGSGHQYGLQYLIADEYLFLNSDCLFLNDVLGPLSRFLAQHPQAGMISGIVFDRQGRFHANYHPAPNIVEMLLGRALLRVLNPPRYPRRSRQPPRPIAVEVVGGAALYVRANAFIEVGGFDPFFFLYCEEEDLALRMRRAGWNVWVVPAARIEHYGGASTPRDPAYRREFFISFLHYFRKHHSSLVVAFVRLIYAVRLARRIGREPGAAALAWFVFRGAKPAASLRFRSPQASTTSGVGKSL